MSWGSAWSVLVPGGEKWTLTADAEPFRAEPPNLHTYLQPYNVFIHDTLLTDQ
jgi:hypothetical protein